MIMSENTITLRTLIELALDKCLIGRVEEEKLLKELGEDSALLSALQAAGVDSWDGYDIALDILKEWNAES